MDKPLTIKEFARMGGKAKLKKYGVEHYKEMSKKGVEARRKKKLQNEEQSA